MASPPADGYILLESGNHIRFQWPCPFAGWVWSAMDLCSGQKCNNRRIYTQKPLP